MRERDEVENEGFSRLGRLPSGRHGLSREFVSRNQRDRIAAGMIATVAERGYHDTTIGHIAAAAGVSRRTFYTYYSSKEECFFATYDMIGAHLRAAVEEASAGEEEWPEAVRATLRATLEFFAANPDLARFCLIAPRRAGEEIAAHYRRAAEEAIAFLLEGKPATPQEPSPAVLVSLLGGMATLVVGRVESGEGARLPDLLPDLVELTLSPFLGREAAVRFARGR